MKDGSTVEADRADTGRDPGRESVAATKAVDAHGVVIGVLAGIDECGRPLVAYAENPSSLPVAARATSNVDPAAAGREVALLFEDGDFGKPLLIGIVQSGLEWGNEGSDRQRPVDIRRAPDVSPTRETEDTELFVDDRRVDIEARERIVLRCGKASITLTSAGKVIIRGAYVSSRSSGANRIKGGSVQIN